MIKTTILSLFAFIAITQQTQAQCLTLKKKYLSSWGSETVTYANKPDCSYCRLRNYLECDDLPTVPAIDNYKNKMELTIAERIDLGWLGMFRTPTSMFDDNHYIAVIYDEQKKPLHTIDLCDVSDTYDCEVQDIRWDNDTHYLMFNMACQSYSSMQGGQCSRLFCYDVEASKMLWSTPYLISNDIFTFNKKYVFCGYGFTDEKDYVFMIDKKTGKVLSKTLISSGHEYMEVQEHDGKELLYVIDYKQYLYIFNINDTTPKPAVSKKKVVRRKKAVKK